MFKLTDMERDGTLINDASHEAIVSIKFYLKYDFIYIYMLSKS